MGRPPRSPLFPYTTLFGSQEARRGQRLERGDVAGAAQHDVGLAVFVARRPRPAARPRRAVLQRGLAIEPLRRRLLTSEEHTSELQSHLNLLCRLLLENKTN